MGKGAYQQEVCNILTADQKWLYAKQYGHNDRYWSWEGQTEMALFESISEMAQKRFELD